MTVYRPVRRRSQRVATRRQDDARHAIAILLAALVAITISAAGVWLIFEARPLSERGPVHRPDLLELGYRFAGVCVWGVGQWVAVLGVIRSVYSPSALDRYLALGAGFIALTSGAAAAAFCMTAG